MRHVGENITSRAVRLDGEEFRDCSFQGCTLEIGGMADLVLDHYTFTDCQWVFTEAATRTLAIVARCLLSLRLCKREPVCARISRL
jgi:hypothetical protein